MTTPNQNQGGGLTLQTVNPSLPDDQQNQMIMQNFQDLENFANSQGPSLLFSLITSTEQSINGGAYITITASQQTIYCNGGLITFDANIFVGAATTGTAFEFLMQLLIDGQVVVGPVAYADANSQGTAIQIPIQWMGVLAAGKHTFQLQGQTFGAGAQIHSNGSGVGVSTIFIRQN